MWTLENQYLLPLQLPSGLGLGHTVFVISPAGSWNLVALPELPSPGALGIPVACRSGGWGEEGWCAISCIDSVCQGGGRRCRVSVAWCLAAAQLPLLCCRAGCRRTKFSLLRCMRDSRTLVLGSVFLRKLPYHSVVFLWQRYLFGSFQQIVFCKCR